MKDTQNSIKRKKVEVKSYAFERVTNDIIDTNARPPRS